MTPDYERAAIKAMETLIKFGITATPVAPLPVLKKLPGTLVISYETMSNDIGMNRSSVMSMFSEKNQDAFTSIMNTDDEPHYIVTYNQKLPFNLLQRALARELGHIILGHDGSRPEWVRNEEARCFACHLLCPRPLIHSVRATGVRLTKEVLGNLTGCYDYCLSRIRRLPAVNVPAELNSAVRDQFMPFIINFFNYQRYASLKDGSAIADFGTYMDGYKEE